MWTNLRPLWRFVLALCWALAAPWATGAEVSLRCDYSTALYQSPEQALAGFEQGHFVATPDGLPRVGWAERPLWMLCQPLAPWPTSARRHLTALPLSVADMEAWTRDPQTGAWQSLGRSGLSVPWALRASRQAGLASLPLPLLQGREPVLVRLQAIGLSVAHLAVQDAQGWQLHRYAAGLATGLLLFFLGLHIAISVSVYRMAKVPAALQWTALMVISTGFLGAVNGFMPLSMPWASVHQLTWALSVAVVALIVGYSVLILPIFEIGPLTARWHGWLIASLWAFVPALWLGDWLWGSPLPAVLHWHVAQGVLMVIIGGLHWRRMAAKAKPVAVLALLTFVSLEWLYLGVLGLLPHSWAGHLAWQVMLAGAMVFALVELLKGNFSERRMIRAERARLHQLLLQEKLQLEQRVAARSTELKVALQDVQRFESHQRELLSLASHEFRTPAAIIKSSLEVVDCLPQSISPEAEPFMASVRTASARLIFLANKLIEHDRWREMSVKPKLLPLELRAWVQEVVAEAPEDHAVRGDLCEEPVRVQADAVLLRIALQNLIDNAWAHNDNGGTVLVSLRTTATQALLIVDDTGKGVPDRLKPQVFERFFSERSGQAHGLGLSIVRAVARLHGGDAKVADAPGGGARFVINLPCCPEEAA